jgi:Invasion associated locus B (IalB) protein
MHLRRSLLPCLLMAVTLVPPALAQQPAPDAAPSAQGTTLPKKPPKPRPPAAAKPAAAAAPAPAAVAGGAKPTLLSQYGEWGAYTASPGGKKICFAIAKPSSSETVPADRPRNPPYMFISSRPADKVSNEVSIIIGYAFKPNSEATAEVGTTSFALSTQQDGAWVKNATEEAHMVEALRAGQSAIVKGVSAKGTRSTDTFSLRGLAQALDRVDQECK